jgi:hypothetical protein
MTPKQFAQQCKATFEADPLLDFVKELVAQNITEARLCRLLKTQHRLPDTFKVALQNKYRDFVLTLLQ